jgi:predicted AAA+ superfamily ATPase
MKDFAERPKYFERIKPFIGKPIIKVLTGQRRVGKSYLLRQIARYAEEQLGGNIVWVDKEDEAFRHIVDADSLIAHIKQATDGKEGKMHFVLIDEIQEIADFEIAVRSFAAKKGFDLYITGSNSEMLSSELSSRLSGRYIDLQVYSLDFEEFCLFHQLPPDANSLNLFLKYGGMPFLKHLSLTDNQAYEYLNIVLSNIIHRDIVARYQIRNVNFLDRLVYFLADNIGSMVKAKRIADYLKSQRISISVNTVLDYLEHLSASHIVLPVKRMDLRRKKTFEVGEKYYFQDTGIRNALTGCRLPDIGALMENTVHHHLVSNGYEVFTGDWQDKEIDFVAQKDGERIYVQVAYLLAQEDTIAREFGNLLEIKDNFRKIVVSMDPFQGHSYQGVEHFSLLKFLGEVR